MHPSIGSVTPIKKKKIHKSLSVCNLPGLQKLLAIKLSTLPNDLQYHLQNPLVIFFKKKSWIIYFQSQEWLGLLLTKEMRSAQSGKNKTEVQFFIRAARAGTRRAVASACKGEWEWPLRYQQACCRPFTKAIGRLALFIPPALGVLPQQ